MITLIGVHLLTVVIHNLWSSQYECSVRFVRSMTKIIEFIVNTPVSD